MLVIKGIKSWCVTQKWLVTKQTVKCLSWGKTGDFYLFIFAELGFRKSLVSCSRFSHINSAQCADFVLVVVLHVLSLMCVPFSVHFLTLSKFSYEYCSV